MLRAALLIFLFCLVGCQPFLEQQPKQRAYSPSPVFADESSARPLVAGTIPFAADSPPPALNRALLKRGQRQYQIYCAVCHDSMGEGHGLAVERGFPPPPSLHSESVRQAPDAHLMNVIAYGQDKMPGFAASLTLADRNALVHFVRALQLSRRAPATWLSADDRAHLDGSGR